MSLRLKLILLFTALLSVTLIVSAFVGRRLADGLIEDDVFKRTKASGLQFVDNIEKSSSYDQKQIEDRLKSFFDANRNILRSAEFDVGGTSFDRVFRCSTDSCDFSKQREPELNESRPPPKAEKVMVDGKTLTDPTGRYYLVSFHGQGVKAGRNAARLTLEAELAEVDALAGTQLKSFLAVGLGGFFFLVFALEILFSRFIGRPISQIAAAMAQAESGRLDVEAPYGEGPEFDFLARGFNTMVARIRGFDREKSEQIAQATADLARKNHALLELNDVLVAARRDLTAKERLAALGQLAGTIAHELGNPLNSISGHVQLLERREDLPANAREDLKLVSSEVRRMTDVIRRFLDSTRGLRPAPEQVDLQTLVAEALDMSLSAEARARLTVTRNVDAALQGIVTDPSLVRHVLTNFIANAVDALPQGGAIAVAATAVDGEFHLSVHDTGTGIPPEDRRRIFEPFYTTKPRGKGTGLGLAICREIALALKGRIDVESEPGKGSTFTLAVPLHRTGDGRWPDLQTAEAST